MKCAVEALESRRLLSAALLVDTNLANLGGGLTSPSVTLGSTTYFTASKPRALSSDPIGTAIWKTDGTTGGTVPLVDVTSPASLTRVGDQLYFADLTGSSWQIWKFDTNTNTATQVGTVPGLTAAPTRLTSVGSSVFFSGTTSSGTELYRSDGVTTALVADIGTGVSSNPGSLTSLGGLIYFTADDGTGRKLWKSDGTGPGTVKVADVIVSVQGAEPDSLAVVGTTLYFPGNDGVTGRELWKSDGTAAGTTLVTDLAPGALSSSPTELTVSGGALFLTATTPATGRELWKSDGTAIGTTLVADVAPGPISSSIGWLASVGGAIYFSANDGITGQELWKSDGTAAGTARVIDLVPGLAGSNPSRAIGIDGGIAVFTASTASGIELWRTNGTTAGTFQLGDIAPGAASSNISQLSAAGPLAYFSADNGVDGAELYRTDGSAAGTWMLRNIVSYTLTTQITHTITAGGIAFFNYRAEPFTQPAGLWRTDGTAAGTFKLSDLASIDVDGFIVGSNSALPTAVDLGGVLLFNNTVDGELWRSDGTVAGTYRVRDINPTTIQSSKSEPSSFAVVNGIAYFSAMDGARGHELWRSDGTSAGTFLVKDIVAGGSTSNAHPRNLTEVNGVLYFTVGGDELWKSDGTAGGTVRVYDFNAGDVFNLVNFNGVLLLAAGFASSTNNCELWRSDGTTAGTQIVVDLMPGVASTFNRQRPMMVVGSKVMFAGETPTGTGLFRTDGTAAGTTLLGTLHTASTSGLRGFMAVGETLYFSAGTTELWRSDGTVAGTQLLRTFVSTGNTEVLPLGVVDGQVYLYGNDGIVGRELWKTDGTPAGTVLANDIFPGALPGNPGWAAMTDGRLIFAATDPLRGQELWKVDATPVQPATPTGLSVSPLSRGRIELTWTDPSAVETHFRLERSTSPAFATIDRSVRLPANTTTYVDSVGILPGVQYHYRLIAFNAAAASSPVTASATALAVPAAATGLVATATSGGGINLNWSDAATNEAAYRVDRSLYHDFSTVDASFVLPAGATSYVDTTTAFKTRYFHRVVAVNAAGDSSPATAMSFTGDAPPVLQAWGISPSEISLQWQDNSSTENYFSIERALSAGGPFTQVGTVTLNKTSYVDTGRVEGKQYFYKVVAIAIEGPAAESNVVAAVTAPAQLSNLVKDLNDAENAQGSIDPVMPAVVMNGVGYFVSSDVYAGRELWRSDGTASGTYRVADLYPGAIGAEPQLLTVVGNTLYFTAIDSERGRELWRSDGTAAGTVLVRDLTSGAADTTFSSLTASGGKLFFVASDGVSGLELWTSDGTAAGTAAIDVLPGAAGISPMLLKDFNGVLYFTATLPETGRELWRSDGTLAGTTLVADVNPGEVGSSPSSLAGTASHLYFVAGRDGEGREIWRTDGTLAGTILLKDINPGSATSSPSIPVVAGSSVFFTASSPGYGRELWKSDGTAAGTVLVKDITVGTANTTINAITATAWGVSLLVSSGGNQRTLWRSDGTDAGTTPITEVTTSTAGTTTSQMLVIGPTLYLFGGTTSGWQLWKSDGTVAGTEIVSTFTTSSPGGLTALGSNVLFAAHDLVEGKELWVTAGTAATTVRLTNLRLNTRDANPDHLTAFKGSVYFTTDAVDGFISGLWRTDGTAAGTVLIRQGDCSGLAVAGDYLYFRSTDAATGSELWRTDGTAAGTAIVADLTAGATGTSIRSLIGAGSKLFFTVGVAGVYQLWVTEGTAATTFKVTDTSVYYHSYGSEPVAIGGTLYFGGSVLGSSGSGEELWKSDGTIAGTTIVKDIYPGSASGFPYALTPVNGTLYFGAWSPGQEYALWRSDGTESGTTILKDVYEGSDSPPVAGLAASGDYLYFTANDPIAGREAWRTDGTPAGTVMIGDIAPGSVGSSPGGYTRAGNATYFVAHDGVGRAVWKVDDVTLALTQVRSIVQSSSYQFSLWGVNNTLFYFDNGYLWRSDGTTTGTVKVTQSHRLGVTNPHTLGKPAVVLGDMLYFRAYELSFGQELRSVSAAPPAAPSGLTASTIGGSSFGAGTGSTPSNANIRLQWTDNASNEAGFVIERSAEPSFATLDRSFFVEANSTSFIDAFAAAGTTWYYRLHAVNAAGQSAYTNVITPPTPPLDVGWTPIVIENASESEVRAMILAGRNGGTWNGTTGITSSLAAADPGNLAIGYIVNGAQITVALTILGDANLDGVVNVLDRGVYLANVGQGERNWQQGDWNYDGIVNVLDRGIYLGHVGQSRPTP